MSARGRNRILLFVTEGKFFCFVIVKENYNSCYYFGQDRLRAKKIQLNQKKDKKGSQKNAANGKNHRQEKGRFDGTGSDKNKSALQDIIGNHPGTGTDNIGQRRIHHNAKNRKENKVDGRADY